MQWPGAGASSVSSGLPHLRMLCERSVKRPEADTGEEGQKAGGTWARSVHRQAFWEPVRRASGHRKFLRLRV